MIAYFAQRGFLARIITVMVLLLGIASFTTLKLQEYPDVAFDAADVQTFYPGATAQDVELNITNPIEKELRSVQGINFFFSESSDGHSFIELEFEPGQDSAKVLRDIQQAVDRVSGLPKDITNPPVVTQRQTSSFEVLTFGVSLTANNFDTSGLQQYARQLEKSLLNTPGVSSVSMSGYNEREFWVEIDPDKASRYHITMAEISAAIEQHNLSQSGGIVESWDSEKKIVTMTQVQSTSDIGQIVIKALNNGTIVHVADVAHVVDTFAKATQLGTLNDQQAILFSVTNSGSADIVATVDNVKALLTQEQQRFSQQYQFNYGVNLADDMSDKFSIVATNGAIGLALVLIVLSMILKRQVAFWVSVSIPFCILGVLAVLPLLGLNLDSITLAALLLVIGIIVDDSVIVAESIYQEKERGKSGLDAAIAGSRKVMKPIIASLSTTALVFIPMMFIPGTMGKAVIVIPITVIAALLFSLAECTLTLPAHLSTSLESNRDPQQHDRFTLVSHHYRKGLTLALRFKKSVLTLSLLLCAVSVGFIASLKIDFFPSEAAKYIEIYTEVKPGTPLEQVPEAHKALQTALSLLPENEVIAYEMTYSTPISQGVLTLTSYEQRERTAADIIQQLNTHLEKDNAALFVKLSIDAGGPPPGEPVEVRILGGTAKERDQAISLVTDWLGRQTGISGVTHNEALKDPQLNIVPQYNWLAKYHLTVNDLSTALRIAFDGNTVSSTWLGDQEVDIRIILAEAYRDIEKLKTTKIYTAEGKQVPLSRLAKVELIEAPRLIKHYNGEREVTVTAQIDDDSVSPLALSEQLVSELAGQYAQGVTIDVGGEAESTNETMSGFMIAFPAAIVAIYFVLAIMFNSLLQPLLVMAVIPFAVIAALMALVVHFQPLSLFALIGVLGMTGVVVNNSLVLINRINELRRERVSTVDAVIEASVSRLRPILLTSLTTVAGLLPLAYGVGGTDVYMGPMSLTLGYGLLFSLPVVLLIIPSLYALCFVRKG